jgi:hypothetical protein
VALLTRLGNREKRPSINTADHYITSGHLDAQDASICRKASSNRWLGIQTSWSRCTPHPVGSQLGILTIRARAHLTRCALALHRARAPTLRRQECESNSSDALRALPERALPTSRARTAFAGKRSQSPRRRDAQSRLPCTQTYTAPAYRAVS